MRYAIDFDGTLFELKKDLSLEVRPILKNISKVNDLFEKGNKISIYTSRGMLSAGSKHKAEKKYKKTIEELLSKNSVKYHELIFGKLSADVYVDDLCVHSNSFSNRVNVLYGKFGRSIDFDSFSPKGGHFEALGQIKILSSFCNVYLFGNISGQIPFDNVKIFNYEKHKNGIDIVMIDNGVTRQSEIANLVDEETLKNSDEMIKKIELLKRPVMYSLTDPRLKFKHPLFVEFSQNSLESTLHQDKLCLLSLPFIDNEKQNKCIIVGRDNGRGKMYDEFISKIRKSFCEVDVYGNLQLEKNKDCLRGLINANEVGEYYSKYKYSLMIPISLGWITQKYCESIHFGVIPILYRYDENNLFFEKDYFYKIENLKEVESEEKILKDLQLKLLPYYRLDTWTNLYKKRINEVLNNENI